jgi:uncharacterized membrane protein
VPDRRYADEWLPTRFSLGTFQLLGYAISRGLEGSRPTSGAYLNRESHQHPLETYLLTLAYWLIPTAQLTLVIADGRPWFVFPIALLALLFLVPNVWVVIAFVFTPAASLISRVSGRPTHDIQALVTPTGMLILAVVSVIDDWPGAALGWLWLVLTVVEVVSLSACLLLKQRFADLDARLPSEAP